MTMKVMKQDVVNSVCVGYSNWSTMCGMSIWYWLVYYFIEEDVEDGYFGQEQVPLTDEIREILEEYPDGQIFKVRC